MKNTKYGQLTQFERDRIKALLTAGHKQYEIANTLKRNSGTISREIKRNRLERDGKSMARGEYDSCLANKKARSRRRFAKYQGKKINENDDLKDYIVARLKKDWSPDEISGKMKTDNEQFYANKNAIYEWLYSIWGQRYCRYLKSKRYNPKKRKKKKTKKSLIPNRIGIEMRPNVINNREKYGHYEGDAIVSGKKTRSRTALIVTIERKSKYVNIRKVSSLRPILFNSAIEDIQKEQLIESMTLDNGIENQYHERLSMDVYFCDPYSSWQKGSIEHVNGMIRKYIPKGVDISKYSDEYIQMIEIFLNNKPRKSLGYKTPKEVMIENNLLIENKKSRVLNCTSGVN